MDDLFWVLGDDGLAYGPVPRETLVEWVAEGRIHEDTLVRRGGGSFRAAPLHPEMAELFPGVDGAGSDGGAGVPPPRSAGPAPGAARIPATFDIGAFFSEAWRILTIEDIALVGLVAFLVHAVPHVTAWGSLLVFVVGGAVWVGVWRSILLRLEGRPIRFGEMFSGFDRFGAAFVASLVMIVLITVGLFFLLVPGILLAILWMFTYPVLGETRVGFWEAMDRSAALTSGYRWELFLMALVAGLLLFAGFLALGIGFFVALPVVLTAFALAYRFLQRRALSRAGAG